MVPIQTVVEHIESGARGVVCKDLPGPLSCNGPGEISVVWDGSTVATGTQKELLRIIRPENAIADPKRCGAGKGADCCIFLVVGAAGFECQRFGTLRWDLIFRTMAAKRHPDKLFPGCYLQ